MKLQQTFESNFSQTIHVNIQSIHSIVESQQQCAVVGSTSGHVQEVGHDDDGANRRVDEQGGADPGGPDRHGREGRSVLFDRKPDQVDGLHQEHFAILLI